MKASEIIKKKKAEEAGVQEEKEAPEKSSGKKDTPRDRASILTTIEWLQEHVRETTVRAKIHGAIMQLRVEGADPEELVMRLQEIDPEVEFESEFYSRRRGNREVKTAEATLVVVRNQKGRGIVLDVSFVLDDGPHQVSIWPDPERGRDTKAMVEALDLPEQEAEWTAQVLTGERKDGLPLALNGRGVVLEYEEGSDGTRYGKGLKVNGEKGE